MAITSFKQTKVACTGGAILDEIGIVSTGGTSLGMRSRRLLLDGSPRLAYPHHT